MGVERGGQGMGGKGKSEVRKKSKLVEEGK